VDIKFGAVINFVDREFEIASRSGMDLALVKELYTPYVLSYEQSEE